MTWVPVPDGSDFPIENLPYGMFTTGDREPSLGVAVGQQVVDVSALSRAGAFPDVADGVLATLDRLMAAGRPVWSAVRRELTTLLTDEAARPRVEPAMVPQADVTMLLPFAVGDYVDFYSSIEHATNIGRLFRPDAEPLTPNWRHLPIGYHGRAGTVVVSGTSIARPAGQRRGADGGPPVFGPSMRLDIEAEVGFVVGTPSPLGQPVPTAAAKEHVFGLVLVNDWSARDIQAWEYQPLGPFLGKSFATTISPWVVPLAALAGARVPAPVQDPQPLPYLRCAGDWGLDLRIEVEIGGGVVSRPPFAGMYWTISQQLAHATVNGAALRTGDLFASGTVSGPDRHQRGSLIELSWGGTEPVRLADGSTRTFLEDGDSVTLRARTGRGPRLGFGECTGKITPSGP